MEFVALDFETANADMSSICQLGLVLFKDGSLLEEWKTYIDPEDFFNEINVSIHGIDMTTIMGAPQTADVQRSVRRNDETPDSDRCRNHRAEPLSL